MVPDSNDGASGEQSVDGESAAPVAPIEDGAGFDEAALYNVVRLAVKDALLDVIGTLLLVGIGFVLVVAGGQAVFGSAAVEGVAFGVALVAVGVYIAASALEIVPPIREWA